MTLYSLTDCENLISLYVDKGGYVEEKQEGVLGLGLVVCGGEGLKTAVIREVPRNEWCSLHTVRFYNECPKKYL